MRPGDRLIAINGESMEGITKEHALRILTQLKLKLDKKLLHNYVACNIVHVTFICRRNSKEYEIVYGRKDSRTPPTTSSTMPTPARKIQPVGHNYYNLLYIYVYLFVCCRSPHQRLVSPL